MDQYLHRVVGSLADGILDGARGLGEAATGAVQGAGKAVMTGLDGPFKTVTGMEGPHRIVDRLADGAHDGVNNAVGNGLIGSIRIAGEAIMKALDHPLQQLKLGRMGLPKLPKFGR